MAAPRPPPEKALEIFAHVLAAGKLWLDRINGMAEAKVAVWQKLAVRDCVPLSKANADAFREVLDAASGADLKRIVSYTTGWRCTAPITEGRWPLRSVPAAPTP